MELGSIVTWRVFSQSPNLCCSIKLINFIRHQATVSFDWCALDRFDYGDYGVLAVVDAFVCFNLFSFISFPALNTHPSSALTFEKDVQDFHA